VVLQHVLFRERRRSDRRRLDLGTYWVVYYASTVVAMSMQHKRNDKTRAVRVISRYDPVALLCALPSKRHLFNPTTKCANGVRHMVIGTSPENHGVRAEMVDELQDFLYTSFFQGITLDYSEFTMTK